MRWSSVKEKKDKGVKVRCTFTPSVFDLSASLQPALEILFRLKHGLAPAATGVADAPAVRGAFGSSGLSSPLAIFASRSASEIESEMRRFSRSIPMIFALTCWPSVTTSLGRLTRFSDSCEM